MANLSANTLFHFTETIENLMNILENGIRVSECEEYSIKKEIKKYQ